MSIESEALPYISRLADKIAETVHDGAVLAAFRAVPRHPFLMSGFYLYDYKTSQRNFFSPEKTDLAIWLNAAYEDEALATVIRDTEATSSSSQPSLMAQMLTDLDIRPGMRVLEIGTGTGYNAALLAHLVGASGEVVTIDSQPLVTDRAIPPLAAISGQRVTVYTGNGLLGVAERAPYDRIIATGSYPLVPASWIDQLQVGGKLIMNMGERGALLLLEKQVDGSKGHILKNQGYFMPLVNTDPHEDALLDDIDLPALCTWDFTFFCSLVIKGARVYSIPGGPDEPLRLYFYPHEGPDGIILQQAGSQVKMIAKGARAFAEQALAIIHQWQAIGKPNATTYVFEVTPDGRQLFRLPSAPGLSFELHTQ